MCFNTKIGTDAEFGPDLSLPVTHQRGVYNLSRENRSHMVCVSQAVRVQGLVIHTAGGETGQAVSESSKLGDLSQTMFMVSASHVCIAAGHRSLF